MAKLVLTMDGLVLKEISLTKERTTIGRKPHNDIQIDNLAVSGEHAVVVTILSDSFLEDLGSTNGTLVNGQPIKKHFLQNNDVIELGKYRLRYVGDAAESAEQPPEFEKTMVLRPPSRQQSAAAATGAGSGLVTHGGGATPPVGLVDTSRSPLPEADGRAGPFVPPTQPPLVTTSQVPGALARTQPQVMMSRPGGAASPDRLAALADRAAGVLDRTTIPPPPGFAARAAERAGGDGLRGGQAAPTASVPASTAPSPAAASGVFSAVPPAASSAAPSTAAPGRLRLAAIQILTGSNAGRELELQKPLTTLGRPHVQVAVITRRPQGYFITHVEGPTFPVVNGRPLDAQATLLKDHDIVELAGVKMEFYYKE